MLPCCPCAAVNHCADVDPKKEGGIFNCLVRCAGAWRVGCTVASILGAALAAAEAQRRGPVWHLPTSAADLPAALVALLAAPPLSPPPCQAPGLPCFCPAAHSATVANPSPSLSRAVLQVTNRMQADPFCQQELRRAEIERADDIRLNRHLFRACTADIKRFCAGMQFGACIGACWGSTSSGGGLPLGAGAAPVRSWARAP